jgi:tartrate dehydratase beta subunit/fumarate hydratase class I family protein
VIKREAEILKYKDLTMAVQCVSNVKVKEIPVTIGGDWNRLRITQTVPA